MIPCQELKAKRKIRVKKLLRKQYVSKQSTELHEYKIAKSSSLSVRWKLNTSLTQKDTKDRGAWIKKFRKKGMQEDSKERTKVQKQKSAKWHMNEEQMNISTYHMLQSCGIQYGSYPMTEVKNETHILGLKRVI